LKRRVSSATSNRQQVLDNPLDDDVEALWFAIRWTVDKFRLAGETEITAAESFTARLMSENGATVRAFRRV
jgi:hypothetical protein